MLCVNTVVLAGIIPAWLMTLPALELLDFSYNQFIGRTCS